MQVLRNGEPTVLQVKVSRKGMLGVLPENALDVPLIAEVMEQVYHLPNGSGTGMTRPTAVGDLRLMPTTRVNSIGDRSIEDWTSMWSALREESLDAFDAGKGVVIPMTVTLPMADALRETLELKLSADDVRDLHDLNWQCGVSNFVFDAIYTVRSAEGDPVKALTMGVQETHKLIMMTYLTIDRLFRRTVGVEQLRGPVGIMHIGVNIVDRGFVYMLFFLGMISVNLAVINFLPLPIVDGGLFLFLIYEKLKGGRRRSRSRMRPRSWGCASSARSSSSRSTTTSCVCSADSIRGVVLSAPGYIAAARMGPS